MKLSGFSFLSKPKQRLSMTFNYLDAYTPTLLKKKLKFTINYIDFLIDNLSFRHTSHLVCEVTCFYILKRA